MKTIEGKLDKLDERYLNDEIELVIYKKWFGKLSIDKAFLNSRIGQLASTNQDKWDMLDAVLEQITDLKLVYQNATLRMKLKLLNVVFENWSHVEWKRISNRLVTSSARI